MKLDHAVVNTQYALDRAQTAFAALGFNLTERGYHSLGSINHLMMFGTDYLELIGLPDAPAQPGQAWPTRAGVSDAPVGINGLVFKTESADATYEHLQKIGMAGDPPKSFTRPVMITDDSLAGAKQTREASFRTVHVRPDCFPAGRVYFCEHHTPELVWRPEWQRHDNGASSIAAIVLVSGDPALQANAFATLLDLAPTQINDGTFSVGNDDFAIKVSKPSAYFSRYGSVAGGAAESDLSERSFFGALSIRTENQSFVRDAAWALGYTVKVEERMAAERTLLRQPEFNTVLEFVSASRVPTGSSRAA